VAPLESGEIDERPAEKPVEVIEREPDVAPTPRPIAASRANRILDVSTRELAGRTVVTITGNGTFSDSVLRVAKLENPARVWIRIRGIESYYRPNEIAVDSPEVARVRIGHHPEESPPSIYVVLDLSLESVGIAGSEIRGDTIEVSVARP
jgi:hypothetical protein